MKRILVFLFLIKTSISIITIPFTRIYKNPLNSSNLMKTLLYNDLQITIEIGTPSEKYPVLIKLQESPFFILSTNYTGNNIKNTIQIYHHHIYQLIKK